LSLLRQFDVKDEQLRRLTQQVLLLAGGSDRLLPSVTEVMRIVNILPNAKTVILPDSGHACLLEKDVNLYEILKAQDFLANKAQAVHELEMKRQTK
jgi:pimeloyl-ACP methyl ester carboxylesterase